MQEYLCSILFIFACFVTTGYCANGPFYALINSVSYCPDNGTGETFFHSTRLTRVDSEHVSYITNVTLTHSWDETVKAQLVMWSFGNGGWKEAFIYDCQYFCEDLKRLVPEWFNAMFKNSGRDKCPMPEGVYKFELANNILNKLNVPQFPFGRYKLEFRITREEMLSGCLALEVDVKPKAKKKKGRK